MTVSVNGGTSREVFTDFRNVLFDSAWTHDGRAILLSRREEPNRSNWRIVRINLEDGTVQPMTLVTGEGPISM